MASNSYKISLLLFSCGLIFPTKTKRKEVDRRRGGKTISKRGQEWTLPAQLGQLKTGQDGKGDDLPRLWDRIE